MARWSVLATLAALAFLLASTSQAHANADDESSLGGTLTRVGRAATSTVKSTTTTVTSTTKAVTKSTTTVVTETTTAVKTVTGTSSSTVVKPVEEVVTSTTGAARTTTKAVTGTTSTVTGTTKAVTKEASPVPASASRVTAGVEPVVPGKAGLAIRDARVGSTLRAVTNSVTPILDSAAGTNERQGLVGKVVTTLTDAAGDAVPALDTVVTPVGVTTDALVRDLGTTTSDIVDDTVAVVDEVDDVVQDLSSQGGATPVAPALSAVPNVPAGTDGSNPGAVTAPQSKTPSHPAASVTVPATATAVDADHELVAHPGHTMTERVTVSVGSVSVANGQAGTDGLVASGVTSLLGASAAGNDLVPSQLGYLSRAGWLASFLSERFLNVGVKGFTLATQPGCSPD